MQTGSWKPVPRNWYQETSIEKHCGVDTKGAKNGKISCTITEMDCSSRRKPTRKGSNDYKGEFFLQILFFLD